MGRRGYPNLSSANSLSLPLERYDPSICNANITSFVFWLLNFLCIVSFFFFFFCFSIYFLRLVSPEQLEEQNQLLREQNQKCNEQLELLRSRLRQMSHNNAANAKNSRASTEVNPSYFFLIPNFFSPREGFSRSYLHFDHPSQLMPFFFCFVFLPFLPADAVENERIRHAEA